MPSRQPTVRLSSAPFLGCLHAYGRRPWTWAQVYAHAFICFGNVQTCIHDASLHAPAPAQALDVGSGSGYLTAVMAYLVGQEGSVLGVEHIPQLVYDSIEGVARAGPWAQRAMEAGA